MNANIALFAFEPCDSLETIYLYRNSTADDYFRTDRYNKIYLSESTPGDLNDDGDVNSIDAVLLAQHLANWDVQFNESAADCNGDGEINSIDAVLLAQYLAGWDVTLG